MIRSLAFLTVFTPLIHGSAPGFKVKYMDTKTGIGMTSFIPLPQNVTAAKSEGWIQLDRPDGPAQYSSLKLWCPSDDYNIGVLYDDTEYACGLQIALLKDDLSGLPFDMKALGYTEWTATINGEEKSYYVVTEYLVSGETLAKDSTSRAAARSSSKFVQEENVYVTGAHGQLHTVSLKVEDLEDCGFTKQRCAPKMGTHYYYNMTSSLECVAENMMPWFVIVDGDEVVGISWYSFGQSKQSMGKVNHLEAYNSTEAIQAGFSDAPQCLFDYGVNPGMMMMHVYYTENPYDITCD